MVSMEWHVPCRTIRFRFWGILRSGRHLKHFVMFLWVLLNSFCGVAAYILSSGAEVIGVCWFHWGVLGLQECLDACLCVNWHSHECQDPRFSSRILHFDMIINYIIYILFICYLYQVLYLYQLISYSLWYQPVALCYKILIFLDVNVSCSNFSSYGDINYNI